MNEEALSLSPADPLWKWAEAAICRRAREMLRHREDVREGVDIEAVHDMRVGSRRLVAAMRVFRAAFPDAGFRRLTRAARKVTRELGAVRDLEVLIDHWERGHGEGRHAPLARQYLLIRLRRKRDRARKPLLEALDVLEKREFLAELRDYFNGAHARYEAGHPLHGAHEARDTQHGEAAIAGLTPFAEAAQALLRARLEELLEYEPYAARPDAVEELHEMRIRTTWLRYTMELFAQAYPDELKGPIRAAKRIQELLGDLHDADVRLQLVGDTLAEPLNAGALVDLGLWLPDPVQHGLDELRRLEAVEREGTYRDFYKEWNRQKERLSPAGAAAAP